MAEKGAARLRALLGGPAGAQMLVPGPVTTRCPRGPRGLLTRAAVVAEAAERNPEASGRSSEPLLGAERPPLLEGAVLSW